MQLYSTPLAGDEGLESAGMEISRGLMWGKRVDGAP